MNSGSIPLEDTWLDVLGKARRGHGLSDEEITARSGLTPSAWRELLEGNANAADLGKVAGVLGLDPESLGALAAGAYHPGKISLPEGMAMFTSPWHDFEVHSYLLWDPSAPSPASAAAFDTGSDASDMLDFIRHEGLALGQVFLTHGHGDHVFELDRLVERSRATVWIGEGEEVSGAEVFRAGREFAVGSLRIETRSTRGHSPGGITYVIRGLSRPVAIVGDALFAGSMGGPMVSYEESLRSVREEVLSLPPETMLCPGHGPLTTVALERGHNPFFSVR
jgi:glyoxylase-like metal-dependent hydrolase (beta-lactamase superfamily II)